MGEGLIVRRGGGSAKVTIDGVEVKDELNLQTRLYDNESVSTLPYCFYDGCAVVYNNEIHILGGGTTVTSATKHYKWNGSSWTSVSTLPYGFKYGGAVVYNNEIHIFGGSSNTTKHYKWNGSAWTSVSTLPFDFYYSTPVILNNEIHLLSYSSHYKWNGSSWTSVSTLPMSNCYGNSVVVFNGEIYLFGAKSNATRYYKWNGSAWTLLSLTPSLYFYAGTVAVVYHGKIHAEDSGEYYELNGSTWTTVRTHISRGSYPQLVVFNDTIHRLGGLSEDYGYQHISIDNTSYIKI